jgi:hypothetical protein
MFAQLGDLVEEPNGKMRITRNGQTLSMHARGKTLEAEEVICIRHFLNSSAKSGAGDANAKRDLIVVLDHSGARLFHAGTDAPEPAHVEPHDPTGHDQQVHKPKGDDDRHGGPHRKQFYEAVAKRLKGAERILMIGDGRGASNEIAHFLTEMETHHQELAGRVIGNEILDLHHMSDGEMLAKANDLFAEKSK